MTRMPSRHNRRLRLCALALALALGSATGPVFAQALTPAFTYQGELRLASGPATASYDMQFRLFNAASDGAQIGSTVAASNVAVSGGLFSVPLNFGVAQFAGERQWLEIAIRPAGSGTFETLIPRTEVTAAPYAWSAAVALGNSVTTTSIVDGAVGTADINAVQVQRRVSGTCATGQYVRLVNQDGTVTCGTDANAGGTLTSIATGTGLTGGPITATGTISVAPGGIGTTQINATEVQRRVTGTCAAGQYVRLVNQDGTVTCGSDANAGGTVTSIATGAGLTGGPITATGTISVAPGGIGTTQINATQVQRRVGGTCAVGSYVRQVNEDGTVLCGTDAIGADWSLTGNVGTDPATNFIGTMDSQAVVLRANNQQALRIEPTATSPNLIGGFSGNTATAGVSGATIGGGGQNGSPNRVTDLYGVIAGGRNNLAGDNAGSQSDRAYATVGGGQFNIASGGGSTIGGGDSNIASASNSTVGGGVSNTASGRFSTVSGGVQSTASGDESTVGGGFSSVASGRWSTVSGGVESVASGTGSTVGGGELNAASASGSTVGGGELNAAIGSWSTVGGGQLNCAAGAFSWAGGRQAKVRAGPFGSGLAGTGCEGVPATGDLDGDNGTFVWSDSVAANFVSTGPNQFLVRASGGIWLGTTNTVDIPAGRFINTSTGAHLTSGGTWTNASSRALKTAFADVDAADVLSRVLQLGISTWSYRASDEGRHMGPIAEDFHALFGLGGDDASISTVDASGVALAAIQGLNEKLEAERDALAVRVEAVDAENAALRAESTELRARLAAIEARLGLSGGGEN